MAGIECRLVLVDTRDNGIHDMILPSLEFNHCIAKATLDNKPYYIELTNNYLPFASLPNNLLNALILEIPGRKAAPEVAELKQLISGTRTKDAIKRTVVIKPNDNDLQIQSSVVKYGSQSSDIRAKYASLEHDKQLTKMEKSIAASYKNNVHLDKIAFQHLDVPLDSVSYTYTYSVKDEIAEIGNLRTFKIAYPDVVASLTNFAAATRTYAINYNDYEDTDYYETNVTVDAPTGRSFIELPKNEELTFKNMRFSLQYTLLSPGKLYILRKFASDRNTIPAADYTAFKTFLEKIVKAEQKMIAYK
jgi:hypothetical protein